MANNNETNYCKECAIELTPVNAEFIDDNYCKDCDCVEDDLYEDFDC